MPHRGTEMQRFTVTIANVLSNVSQVMPHRGTQMQRFIVTIAILTQKCAISQCTGFDDQLYRCASLMCGSEGVSHLRQQVTVELRLLINIILRQLIPDGLQLLASCILVCFCCTMTDCQCAKKLPVVDACKYRWYSLLVRFAHMRACMMCNNVKMLCQGALSAQWLTCMTQYTLHSMQLRNCMVVSE